MRRFLQHVLPPGFVKIRHYGLLASGNIATRLERARALLRGEPKPMTSAVGYALSAYGALATSASSIRHWRLRRWLRFSRSP